MLLAGLPDQWTSYCSHHDQIPVPMQGSNYAVIDKSDLCQCSIVAGEWYIQENVQFCKDTEKGIGKITLHYTINMAVYIYMFLEKLVTQDLWDYSLLTRPLADDPEEPNIFKEYNSDVPGADNSESSMPYDWVVENLGKPIYRSSIDKALAMNDFETWGNSDNGIFGFLFAGAVIAILALTTGLLFYFKVCSLQFRFKQLNTLLSKFTKAQVVRSMLEQGVEAQATEHQVTSESIMHWFELVGLTLFALMILVLL